MTLLPETLLSFLGKKLFFLRNISFLSFLKYGKLLFSIFILSLILSLSTQAQTVLKWDTLLQQSDGEEISIKNANIYIDKTVVDLPIPQTRTSTKVFQLFSHGRPGALFLDKKWRTPEEVADWLKEKNLLQEIHHLNIYGCNFAQGEKGQAAVAYLQETLGITIGASDNITGRDGDWNLEVGIQKESLSFPAYTDNLQGYIDCATILNEEESWYNTTPVSRNINGYTYMVHTPWYSNAPSGTLPVINGDPWQGSEIDGYLAVFDPYCNQILGTHIGGSGYDNVYDVQIDANGDIIVSGGTDSPDFVTTDGSTHSGDDDLFIRKYALDGTMLFSTLYGGTDREANNRNQIILDGTDIYVVGYTRSTDFPTTNGSTPSGDYDNYALKYDANGNLQYATLHGGSGWDRWATGIVVNGNLIMSSSTREGNSYPSTDGTTTFSSTIFSHDGTLTSFDTQGNVIFSTVFGGNGNDNDNEIKYIFSDGTYIYLLGPTGSSDFPTTDGSTNNSSSLFFRKYDLTGNLLVSSVYGGSNTETLRDVRMVNGEFYILIETQSTDFPTTDGTSLSGSEDALIMKIDDNGVVIFSTVYGGTSTEQTNGFYVNNAGEIYLPITAVDAPTTDGSSGAGTVFAKFNADGSLCAATTINNDPNSNYTTQPYVINDTMYVLMSHYSADAISTDGTAYATGEELSLMRFVFCPPDPTVTSATLTPATQNVCENGLVGQILGDAQYYDGSTFPKIYVGGVVQDQPDTELDYQWQVSTSAGGPWTDIPGPVAQQKNYTPPPTTIDQYYQRLSKTSECCGGTTVATSIVSSVLVNGNTAPTVDAGGTFYTCPGNNVMLDATITGGGGGNMYDWDDGTYTIEDPTVAPTQSSVYTLIVTDANGCMQADQATVVIYTADAGEATSVCAGVGTTIGGTPLAGVPVVSSGGTPPAGVYSIEYAWSPATGLSCTDCPNPTATPASDEIYTLTVTLNYPDGSTCSTMDMVTIPVYAAPSNADFAGRDTVVCLGETVDLGDTAEPGIDVDFSGGSVTQSSVDGGTATIANLTDNDFATGGHTQDNGNIMLDLGSIQTINTIQIAALSGFTSDDAVQTAVSTDNVTYTTVISNNFSGYSATSLTSLSIPTQDVRYIRFSSRFSSRDVSISEVRASLEYVYSWTPGENIATNGSMATFDAGSLTMPTNNPITYTVNANIGTCNFYDQVTVAVIEARADEDYCGPRTVGEPDRTPNIEETYSWVKITDAGITTGTGDFLGVMDEAVVPVSASTGGNVGYELTVSYTLSSGTTGICKDTVIVPPLCGEGCDVVSVDGGCPDFDDGNPALIGIPPNSDDPENWTYSWTSNEGMVGLDSYTTQTVNLTDNGDRRYYVTFTSVIDPTYTCVDSIDANSAAYSVPSYTAATPVTSCPGVAVNIGDPASNPGLTYEWSNASKLDDATISYPEATVNASTEFTVTVTDNVTGCQVVDTVQVNVPDAAAAGPDLVVCDNGIVTIGGNTETAGYTYSWSPPGADWRNGTDENDAQPDVFVATTQTFTLTVIDPTGTCMSTDDVEVIVESLPPTFMLPDLDFCPSQATALVLGTDDGTATGINQVPTGYTYAWSPATVSDASAMNPTVNTPLPTTSFTYEVTVLNTNGCNQKVTQTINPTISSVLVASNQTICVGESTFIGDAANPTGGGEVYSWSPTTDLSDPASPNPEYSPSAAGTTTFTLTKTVGGCSTTSSVTITVNEATAPMVTPQAICEGGAVQIGVANDPTLQYQWSPTSDLDNAYISNPTFSGTSSTSYTLTVIDVNGCIAEAATSVTVNPAPAVTITLPDTTICDANATSIVINAGIDPTGSYAYQWSPTSNLSNSNILNPTFFIPSEGSYEYILEVIDQATGCSLFDTTVMNVSFGVLPEVTAFAIQSSCVDNVPQNDGYLQLSAVSNGTHYNYSMGSTYSGSADINDATAFNSTTDLPLQFDTLANPTSGSVDYTIRVFNGDGNCFTDVVVTMNEQDCSVGCDCEEYIYLNADDENEVHKFSINASTGQATEIGKPWLSGITRPHGLAVDLNGYLYIGELTGDINTTGSPRPDLSPTGTVNKYNCEGDILVTDFLSTMSPDTIYYNFISENGILYLPSNDREIIRAIDLCTGAEIGSMWIDNGNEMFGWGLYSDGENWYFPDRVTGNIYSGSLDPSQYTSTPSSTGTALFNTGYTAPDTGPAAAMGLTRDAAGNFYLVVNKFFPNVDPTIVKYSPTGAVLTTITTTNTGNNSTDGQSGWYGARGIVYSETTNLLYISNWNNCLAVFDTSLVEQTALNIGNPTNGQPKGIGIIKECCPTNNNVTIDTTLCAASINDTIFLQELVNCDGTICEGLWAEGMSNSGLTYNACNNSVTINALNACGSFTLESDGTGNNSQCGAFKIEVNISLTEVTASVIAADQTICEGGDPDAFTVTTPATGGTLSYQWQSSTTNCTTNFSNIDGATSSTYDPPTGILDTTYYRVIVNSANAGCASGNCADTSNCVTVFTQACDWGDLPDTSATTNASDYQTTSANNGPVHIITTGLNLGSTVDGENDGQPSTDALGDAADEDGVIIFESLDIGPGSTFRLPLSYTNTTGSPAHIEAWIDWNNNGEFDAGEMVLDVTDPSVGLYDRLEVTVPTDAVTGEYLGLRIRISNQDNMTPYGLINGGEVEDYLIGLECPTQICIPINATIKR